MVKIILSIETSCDETSIAVLKCSRYDKTTTFETLSHVTLTQATMHAQYGGVYPNMARREHQVNIVSLIAEALDKAQLLEPNQPAPADLPHLNYLDREEDVRPSLTDFVVSHPQPSIDAIAVTTGPGLEPALWVGVNVARALADYWQLPLIPVNHMEGHIVSVLAQGESFNIPSIPLPALALLISGGHTELIKINALGSYEKIGQTRDDAIGEAFDKVARLMGLPYPGGPEISRLAAEFSGHLPLLGGRANMSDFEQSENKRVMSQGTDDRKEAGSSKHDAIGFDVSNVSQSLPNPSPNRGGNIKLPRPMLHSGNLDFSFSGIKTAVRYLIESLPKPLTDEVKREIAHEFQTAVTDVLVTKTARAIKDHNLSSLIVAGGVSANAHIRARLTTLSESLSIPIYLPTGILAMDNALMIAIAGSLKLMDPDYTPPALDAIRADGNWSL